MKRWRDKISRRRPVLADEIKPRLRVSEDNNPGSRVLGEINAPSFECETNCIRRTCAQCGSHTEFESQVLDNAEYQIQHCVAVTLLH